MCSEAASPTRSQLRPPSRLLYTPSPHATCRPLTFSPVPTHTTSGSDGSIATDPIEYEGWSSNVGVHVIPAFDVFQTPPDPTATYQVAGSSGWTAMSAMRPPMSAGPIPRSARPSAACAMRAMSGCPAWAAAPCGAVASAAVGRMAAMAARARWSNMGRVMVRVIGRGFVAG